MAIGHQSTRRLHCAGQAEALDLHKTGHQHPDARTEAVGEVEHGERGTGVAG